LLVAEAAKFRFFLAMCFFLLQLFLPPANCLLSAVFFMFFFQFLNTGNDIAARETCPCIWIVNPRETGKVLQHIMSHGNIPVRKAAGFGLDAAAAEELMDALDDPSMIAAGVVPGSEASSRAVGGSSSISPTLRHPHLGGGGYFSGAGGAGGGGGKGMPKTRSIEGELGKLCVYTGNVV
jgi:hypothetical protein